MGGRKIIHVDMDAFYASVEQRDSPELKGKPVAVGGGSERGVVCAASYEARQYGVRSAMAGQKAKKLCPELVFINPRFDVYKKVSYIIREIFYDYTDLVEPLSLDEAYLDVTENHYSIPYATQIAKDIRNRIFEETGLTASAGISYNKFLAKTASDINKPDGQKVILPDDASDFLEGLKIEKFYGIGKATTNKMHALNVYNGKDLKKLSEYELHNSFGKSGIHYYHIVRGIDDRVVNPNRIRKSISVENTFNEDIANEDLLILEVGEMAQTLSERILKAQAKGRTITLKLKYSDFKSITRRITVDHPIFEAEEINKFSIHLLRKINLSKPVRLLGIGVSNLLDKQKEPIPQLNLGLVDKL